MLKNGTPRATPAVRSRLVEEFAARLAGDPPFALDFSQNDLLVDAHQLLLRRAIADPPPVSVGTGRGVVQAVGGTKFFACAYASVAVLRAVGCALPVEWWYMGRGEMDTVMAAHAARLGVTCVDALAVAARVGRPRILNGWELKAFAAAHCGFQEFLFLDADNVAVADPTFLFDAPEYRRHGAVFWPDLPPNPMNRPKGQTEWMPPVVWENVGLAYRNEPDFESGQFLVDKARCAKELGVTVHINSHSDWYYKFVFGDKSTFHLAWRVCGSEYGMIPTPAGWAHPAIQQHDFDARVLFQHVCQGKDLLAAGTRVPALVRKHEAADAVEKLRGEHGWGGDIWGWADQSPEEIEIAASLLGRWNYKRAIDPGGRRLELRDRGEIGEGKAGCEQRWAVRVLDGEPTLVIVGCGHKGTIIGMMFLREDDEGVWRGRWEAHERCPVELWRGPEYVGWATESQHRIETESRDNTRAEVVDPGIVECRVLGRYTLYCPLADVSFTPHMVVHGYWESWVTLALARLLRPGMHVVDVGANVGYYTALFAAGVGPTGKALAVEPQTDLAVLISRSAGANGFSWVSVAYGAAGAAPGTAILVVPTGKTCNATMVLPYEGDETVVSVAPVDDLVADWSRVDLVKIDVEGAEEQVWEGMRQTMTRHRPTVVVEFNAARYADPAKFLRSLAEGRDLRVIRLDGSIAPISMDEVLKPGIEHMLVIQ